ncbi:MAG: ABC transporter permease subunit [Thermoplasmata archaeon]
MRLSKIWVVARKDLAELRTNKYVIYTLIFMPIIMAVIIPISFMPAVYSGGFETYGEPVELDLSLSVTFKNRDINETMVMNATVENCTVRSSYVYSSRILNSTLFDTRVNGSELVNVSVRDYSVIRNSNLWDVDLSRSSSTVNSAHLNEDPYDIRVFVDIVLNSMIIFFMMIPAIIPTVIASYSFVGEKTNKSLEPLLATPTTDGELLLGKSLSIFIPTMLATLVSFAVFTIIIDVGTFPVLGFYPVPTPTWIFAVFVLGPLFSVMSIAMNVYVSSKVSDVRASQQLGSLVIMPLVLLMILAITGIISLNIGYLLIFTFFIILIDIGIVYLSIRTFKREEILVRWK